MNDVAPISHHAPLGRLDAGLRFGLGAGLALLCLLVYLPALSAEFVYDDHILIEGNRTVASLGAAFGAFFEPLWAFDPQGEIPNAFWRPLTVLLIAASRALFGLEPAGFHGVSLLLHLAATWACWRLATRLTRCATTGWLAAALFAVHPVHVESVAWASAVNDPLSALFSLLSIERYLAWRERGTKGVPWAAGVLLLVALLAKEQALIVPLVALVIDLSFRHLRARGEGAGEELARAYAPWAVALALYLLGRMLAYGSVLAGFDEVSANFGFGLVRGMQLRLEILGAFMESLFLPGEHRFFRQVRPQLPADSILWTRALIATGLWVVATAVAAFQGRRLALSMLLAIPATFVLLLLRYEAAGAFPISDRFLYLPVAFAAVLVVGVGTKLLPRTALFGLGLALTALAGWRASERVQLFQDDMTLYRAALEAEPDNLRGRVALGNELLELYHDTLEKEYLDEALFHYLSGQMLGFDYGARAPKLTDQASFIARAKELDVLINSVPVTELGRDLTVFISVQDRLASNLGVGTSALALGSLPPEYDTEWPRLIFEQIIKRFPESSPAYDGLGLTLYYQGEYEGAEKALRIAIDKDRTFVNSWHNLGIVLEDLGRKDEARVCFDEALRLRPGHLDDLVHAASCAIDGQRFAQVEPYLLAMEELHPSSLEPLYLRGVLQAVRGDLAGAVDRFDALLAQQDQHWSAHLQKGKALIGLGNREDAIRALRRSAELKTDGFEAHYNLATLLLQNPEAQNEATPYLQRAYQLSPPDQRRAELHRILHQLLLAASLSDQQVLDVVVSYARLDQQRLDFVHALSWIESARLRLEERLADPAAAEADPRLSNNLVFLLNMRGELFEGLANSIEEQRQAYLVSARDSFLAGLSLAPQHYFLNYNLAMLLARKLHQPDQAKAYAQAAIEGLQQLEGSAEPRMIELMGQTLQAILDIAPRPGPALAPDGDGDGDGNGGGDGDQ